MASALQEHEIAASDKTASIGSYELVGSIQEMPPIGGKAALVALWELRDPSGQLSASGSNASKRRPADWQKGRMMRSRALAAASASQLADLLQDEAPTEAGVGGRTRLLIGGVDGRPGRRRPRLARAITELLKRQDLASSPIRRPRPISCSTPTSTSPSRRPASSTSRSSGGCASKDGGEIGTVGQENDVPAGLLDGAVGRCCLYGRRIGARRHHGARRARRAAPTGEVAEPEVAIAIAGSLHTWLTEAAGGARRRRRVSAGS